MDRRPIYVIDSNRNTYQVQWGFFLENTLFRAFEAHNNNIIEKAHQELAHRVGNNYVDIIDQVLGSEARVYFGVERIHLRMPGTRYYVERRLTAISTSSASARAYRWSSPATRRPTVRQPRPSTSAPATLTTQQARRTASRRTSRTSPPASNVVRSSSKLSTMPTPSAGSKTTKLMPGSSSRATATNAVFAPCGVMQMMPSTSAPTVGYGSPSILAAQGASINSPESFDWEIIPRRLPHKPSQDWSHASSSSSSSSSTSSTSFPLSPLASPDFKRKKQELDAKSATPELTAAQPYTHERQKQDAAFLASPSLQCYQQAASSPMDPVQAASSSASTPQASPSQHTAVATGNNLSIDDIDYDMVNALNAMSISFPPQGIPQQGNQNLFLTTPPPMKETPMVIDQLSASDLSSYWVWPTMTTSVHPTHAAGTANLLTTPTNETHFFDGNGELILYTCDGNPIVGYPFQP